MKQSLTGVEGWRNGVKHVCVHVRMYGPVGRGIIASCNENGVPLSNGETNKVDRRCLNVSLQCVF